MNRFQRLRLAFSFTFLSLLPSGQLLEAPSTPTSFNSSENAANFASSDLSSSDLFSFDLSSSLLSSSSLSSSALSPSTLSPPDFLIWLDLAKFKVRLFRNGVPIDSGLVGSGKYYTPTLQVQKNWLIERPSFTPTDNELKAGKFKKTIPACKLAWFSVNSKNPQGRGKIVLVGFFGIHGTNHPELLPGPVSSGCCRMDNLFNDRLHTRLKKELPIREKTGGITKYFYFKKSFIVRLSYSLWDIQSLTDSTLSLRAWPDVHARLTDPPRILDNIKSNDSVSGNGYKLWHLIRDVDSKGWGLKNGLQPDSPQVQQFWQNFRKQMLQVKSRAKPMIVKQTIFQKR